MSNPSPKNLPARPYVRGIPGTRLTSKYLIPHAFVPAASHNDHTLPEPTIIFDLGGDEEMLQAVRQAESSADVKFAYGGDYFRLHERTLSLLRSAHSARLRADILRKSSDETPS